MSAAVESQLVWLYDAAGNQKIALHQLLESRYDWQFQGSEELTFVIDASDPKADYLQADQIVRVLDRVYRNVEMIDRRRDNRIEIEVRCEALYYDLIGIIRVGNLALLGKTPLEGITQLLNNTGWSVGTITNDIVVYSAEGNDKSVLQWLKDWAKVTGNELRFDSLTKTVDMISDVGSVSPLAFRYGRNIRGMERRYKRPVATRLYPYGAGDLNISGTNPTGLEYVENYDWYVDVLGLTLSEARNLYRKDNVWVDQRYLSAVNLYDAAVLRIAQLAQPILSYDVDIADLTTVIGTDEQNYEPGDYVRVTDLEFGVDLQTRVVRRRADLLNPQKDQIELDFLRGGLTDAVETSDQRSIDYSSPVYLVDSNADPITANTGVKVFAGITITVSGTTTPIMGAVVSGTATGTGTLQAYATVDGTEIGDRLEYDFVDGDELHLAWPTYVADLDEGTYVLDWRVIVSSGTGTVEIGVGFGRAWALVRGAVGVGFASSPNQTVTEEVVSVTPGSLTAAVSASVELVDHSVTATAAPENPTLGTITVDELLPFTLDNPVFGRLDGQARLDVPLAEEWDDV